jgi:hypothetical protein
MATFVAEGRTLAKGMRDYLGTASILRTEHFFRPVRGELLILAEDRAVAETCTSVGER